jgi:hypothetical protein
MTRQLISTNKQPLLRSSHAKRPPQNGFVQVGISSGNQALTRCAFIGTNPTGELITSGLPVNRPEQWICWQTYH